MFFICIYLVLQRKILGILTYHHIFRCLRFTYPISGLGHHHPKQITPKEGLCWEPFPISIVQPHDNQIAAIQDHNICIKSSPKKCGDQWWVRRSLNLKYNDSVWQERDPILPMRSKHHQEKTIGFAHEIKKVNGIRGKCLPVSLQPTQKMLVLKFVGVDHLKGCANYSPYENHQIWDHR